MRSGTYLSVALRAHSTIIVLIRWRRHSRVRLRNRTTFAAVAVAAVLLCVVAVVQSTPARAPAPNAVDGSRKATSAPAVSGRSELVPALQAPHSVLSAAALALFNDPWCPTIRAADPALKNHICRADSAH